MVEKKKGGREGKSKIVVREWREETKRRKGNEKSGGNR